MNAKGTWRELPEGYYAVPNPSEANEGEMSYWRRKDKGKNKRPSFEPWPLKARYGPRLLTIDPRLKGLRGKRETSSFGRGMRELLTSAQTSKPQNLAA
jgi:hypothetical protein